LGEAETYQDRSNKAEMERLLRNLLLYLEKQAGATVRQLGAEYFEYRHMCWEKEKTELRRLAKAHAPEAMEKAAKDFEAA